jgi:hypothetical protein
MWHRHWSNDGQDETEGVEMVKPVAAAVAGALIAGVAMYTVGAKTAQVDAFQTPALVQTVDGGWVEAEDVRYANTLQPAAQPVRTVTRQAAARRVSQTSAPRVIRTIETEPVYRDAPVQEQVVVREEVIGAAIGGGAASIYEATRRR